MLESRQPREHLESENAPPEAQFSTANDDVRICYSTVGDAASLVKVPN